MEKINDKKHNGKLNERVRKFKGSINICTPEIPDDWMPLSEGMKELCKNSPWKVALTENKENLIEQGEKEKL